MSALDFAEPQALLHSPGGACGDPWHPALLRRVKDAEWICPQPDASLVAWSLAAHRIIALLRRVAFPGAVHGYVVEFPAALIGLPVQNAVHRKFESLCVALALLPNYYQLDILVKAEGSCAEGLASSSGRPE